MSATIDRYHAAEKALAQAEKALEKAEAAARKAREDLAADVIPFSRNDILVIAPDTLFQPTTLYVDFERGKPVWSARGTKQVFDATHPKGRTITMTLSQEDYAAIPDEVRALTVAQVRNRGKAAHRARLDKLANAPLRLTEGEAAMFRHLFNLDKTFINTGMFPRGVSWNGDYQTGKIYKSMVDKQIVQVVANGDSAHWREWHIQPGPRFAEACELTRVEPAPALRRKLRDMYMKSEASSSNAPRKSLSRKAPR